MLEKSLFYLTSVSDQLHSEGRSETANFGPARRGEEQGRLSVQERPIAQRAPGAGQAQNYLRSP